MSAVPSSSDLTSSEPVATDSVVPSTAVATPNPATVEEPQPTKQVTPPPSYVKLAMRNMVRKGGKSLFHFALTSIGLMGLLVGLAYLTR